MIRVPPRLVRRIVLAPVVACCALLLLVISPVLFVLAAIVDVFAGGRRTMRFVAFGVVYCAYEVAGIVAVFWLWLASGAGARIRSEACQERHYRLMAWWLRGLQSIGTRLFHIEVVIEDRPPPERGPILVFSRHAGAGNSLMLVATLMLEYGRHPRIIMLEKLQWEPLFDVLLNRLPNRFIRHGAAGRDAQIAAIGALATGLGDRDAFVLFPEGHDFKPALRERAIAHLRKQGHHESAARAERLANVLPPRHGGVMAAIA
ncbi:MAG TPA: 1-acyl-sn-glycerol-3-phosphate acyltransferase, partial [Actinomycetota bacterium]|nr:1-acyl-sn-glycerol-3-phosphate acyltransferase [Actinomycetota bacterium]